MLAELGLTADTVSRSVPGQGCIHAVGALTPEQEGWCNQSGLKLPFQDGPRRNEKALLKPMRRIPE